MTSQPTQTANGEFAYSMVTPWGKSLDELVQIVHRKLSEASGWDYRPLIPGQFGYDNMAMSIGRVCGSLCSSTLEDFSNLEEIRSDKVAISNLVHQGWVDNYCYWRDFEPWMVGNDISRPGCPMSTQTGYIKPYNPLGDDRRNALAAQPFSSLPEEEKKKDELVAQVLLDLEAEAEVASNC